MAALDQGYPVSDQADYVDVLLSNLVGESDADSASVTIFDRTTMEVRCCRWRSRPEETTPEEEMALLVAKPQFTELPYLLSLRNEGYDLEDQVEGFWSNDKLWKNSRYSLEEQKAICLGLRTRYQAGSNFAVTRWVTAHLTVERNRGMFSGGELVAAERSIMGSSAKLAVGLATEAAKHNHNWLVEALSDRYHRIDYDRNGVVTHLGRGTSQFLSRTPGENAPWNIRACVLREQNEPGGYLSQGGIGELRISTDVFMLPFVRRRDGSVSVLLITKPFPALEAVEKLAHKLKPNQQTILELSLLRRCTASQIAAELNTTVKAVEGVKSRALKRLRKIWAANEAEEA